MLHRGVNAVNLGPSSGQDPSKTEGLGTDNMTVARQRYLLIYDCYLLIRILVIYL